MLMFCGQFEDECIILVPFFKNAFIVGSYAYEFLVYVLILLVAFSGWFTTLTSI